MSGSKYMPLDPRDPRGVPRPIPLDPKNAPLEPATPLAPRGVVTPEMLGE